LGKAERTTEVTAALALQKNILWNNHTHLNELNKETQTQKSTNEKFVILCYLLLLFVEKQQQKKKSGETSWKFGKLTQISVKFC
jgi:hypothetical protein